MEVPGPGGGESGGGKGLVLGQDLANLESGVFLTRAMQGILPQPGLRHLRPRGPGARWEGLGREGGACLACQLAGAGAAAAQTQGLRMRQD